MKTGLAIAQAAVNLGAIRGEIQKLVTQTRDNIPYLDDSEIRIAEDLIAALREADAGATKVYLDLAKAAKVAADLSVSIVVG